MDQANETPLKKTPLNARHRALGARMVPFAGWDMPVEYSGITAEHLAVRERAGLFDVSHMGQVEIAGANALEAVQRISCNDATKLQVGQAQYSGLLTPQGTFVDDLLVYRLGPQHFMLVINASHIEKDFEVISQGIAPAGDAVAVNVSSRYALIAVQGPKALEIVQPLTGIDLGSMKYYWFGHGEIAGVRGTVSRTGYTGEDGVEIFLPPQSADKVWLALMEAGAPFGMIPCGLGARDTLRLEAAMCLHGNDIDESTTPVEAGLSWIVGWKKDSFIGSDVLKQQKAEGTARRLVGFEMIDRGIARHGYGIFANGEQVGTVTSGTQTPYLKKAIGLGYVHTALAAPGTGIEIDVRGRRLKATVVPTPFYKRSK